MPPTRVSVVLPVYNGEQYLQEAVESILTQSYQALELIVVDDGSTDGTPDILAAVTDPRLKVIRHHGNRGIVTSLNEAIAHAAGEFIARMDADDVSLPERIERQVAFLDANPAVAVVGTWTAIWSEEGRTGRMHRHPTEPLQLAWEALFDSPLVHPSVMMRTAVVRNAGGYPHGLPPPFPEDFALWARLARVTQFANIPEALLIYRETSTGLSRSKLDIMREHVMAISAWALADATGRAEHDADVRDLVALLNGSWSRVKAPHRLPWFLLILFRAARAIARAQQVRSSALYPAARKRARQLLREYSRHTKDYLRHRLS